MEIFCCDLSIAEYIENFDQDKAWTHYRKLSKIELNWFPEDDEEKEDLWANTDLR